jgi:DinB superfamily
LTQSDNHLRYPIGQFVCPEHITKAQITTWINVIEQFPNELDSLLVRATEAKLDTPYREGGWTVRQVVHHCADSHINSFCRFKLALTEDNPTIKPYREDLWAELPDATGMMMPYASMLILKGIHWRWARLLQSLSETDLKRSFFHPENQKTTTLAEAIGLYAWHCKHHAAHVGLIVK